MLSGYIKSYQVFDPHRVGRITVELQGRVKDCKALTYRQDIKAKEIETYTKQTLPTRQVELSFFCHCHLFVSASGI
ncbi:40S ribosomal protein S15a-5 [Linum perenne]